MMLIWPLLLAVSFSTNLQTLVVSWLTYYIWGNKLGDTGSQYCVYILDN